MVVYSTCEQSSALAIVPFLVNMCPQVTNLIALSHLFRGIYINLSFKSQHIYFFSNLLSCRTGQLTIKAKIWPPGVLHLDKHPQSLGQLMSNSFNWHCTPSQHCTPSTIYNDLCSLPWLQEMRWLPPEQLWTPASIHCVLPSDRPEFIARPAGRCDLEQSTQPWAKFHSQEQREQNAQFATLL